MIKNVHASVRIEKELYAPLQKEADDKYEGNMSLLIRLILKDYVKNKFTGKTEWTQTTQN